MYNNDVSKKSAINLCSKRALSEPHPFFYFISFIGIYYPLADIVIVHIVYINETIPPPPPLCDAVGGAFYYLGSECDHLPEAGNIYIGIHPSTHPSAHPSAHT